MTTNDKPGNNEIAPKQSINIEIIGGPFDKINTVLQEFEPGQKEFMRPLESFGVEPRSVGEVESREVEVTVPSRLHPSVLDMNRFNLNKPGGGGLGFAIEVYMRAKVRSTKNPDIIVNGERTLLMQHYGLLSSIY